MFPHDRHHVLHHTSGRPQLVQRAVLVVDPLQENLGHSVLLLSHQPLPLLPPLSCLLQDANNLYSSSPSKPVGQVLQAPPLVTSHVQVDLLHCCHHPDSLRFAGVYCLHDRSPANAVPLVHQNPRNGQELAQDGNIACVTGVVQSCPVVVLGVHLNARLCQQQVHHLLVVSPYCLHQTGPVVTPSLGVWVSPSEKKFPGHLQLAKAATLPQIVLVLPPSNSSSCHVQPWCWGQPQREEVPWPSATCQGSNSPTNCSDGQPSLTDSENIQKSSNSVCSSA